MGRRHLTLADAEDLITWSQRRDSQSSLPRLVRRLVLASAKVLHVSFRAGEGIQVEGWDGITGAEESNAFVPNGTAGWELSARKDVKAKADEDYENRLKNPDGLEPSQSTLVFVTPRRWPGKNDWAATRSAEGKWRAVLVYDADDLETWLEATPAVHAWLSIDVGKQPEGVIDLGTFWADWSHVTRPVLTTKFIVSGRDPVVQAIHQRLRSASESFAVKAESPEEALAVFAAAVHELPESEREEYLSRSLVVHTREALNHLAATDGRLIILPLVDDAAAISRCIRRGHQVVTLASPSHSDTPTTITVPRLAGDAAERALLETGIAKDKARDLAILGRRSLMALRRKLAMRPEVQHPLWARPENATGVVPLLIVGAWNESNKGDLEAISSLAQGDPQRVQEAAVRWSRESDPPVRSVGNIWYLASREDAWDLVAPALTRADMERVEALALAVLGEVDPRFDIAAEKRWLSFDRPRHSPVLRRGLAETLAIMGARGSRWSAGGIPLDQWAGRIVRALLARANADWRLWASMSHLLPQLAEAAPEAFLTAVENGLAADQPVLKLFQEGGDPLFSSSPHTGLLWALERLAWSSEHLSRTALVLAKLARLDPGGKLANRPRASLRETFLPWHPQTSATWDRQFPILGMLLEREPEAGWRLHVDLLPKSHDTSISRRKPEWRDWTPDDPAPITVAKHAKRVGDLVAKMLKAVGRDGGRWSDLVEALPNLPPDVHDAVTESLEQLKPDQLTSADQAQIWNALRNVIAQHRSFPAAHWALKKERVDRLEAIYQRLQPEDMLTRFEWLFGDHVRLPEGREDDWEAEEKAVGAARREAVVAIHGNSGTAGVEALVTRVENPLYLGATFGATELGDEDEDRILRQYLASQDRRQRNFALGFVLGRGNISGPDWITRKFALEGLTPSQRADILTRLPSERRTWELAGSDPALDEAYWKLAYRHINGTAEDVEYATRQLIRYGRAYTAAELLASHLKDPSPPEPTLIIEALEAVLGQEEVDARTGSFSYWAGKLLDTLASAPNVDETRVARLEWGFAVVLSHDRPLVVLDRELSRNPEFFVDLLTLIYRREDEESRTVSDADRNRATVAHHVLESWKSVPGIAAESTADPEALQAWVDRALTAGADKGRSTIGAEHVGKVLSHGPTGADGAWPHEAIRSVIEKLGNEDMERGFEIGKVNSRGVISRSLTEGGRQEMSLADQYAAWARQLDAQWPRTAAMLRRMEASYRSQARSEDAEAALREDDLG